MGDLFQAAFLLGALLCVACEAACLLRRCGRR